MRPRVWQPPSKQPTRGKRKGALHTRDRSREHHSALDADSKSYWVPVGDVVQAPDHSPHTAQIPDGHVGQAWSEPIRCAQIHMTYFARMNELTPLSPHVYKLCNLKYGQGNIVDPRHAPVSGLCPSPHNMPHDLDTNSIASRMKYIQFPGSNPTPELARLLLPPPPHPSIPILRG